MPDAVILVLNAGSSSLKFAVFDATRPDSAILRGAVTRIGTPAAGVTLRMDGETSAPVLDGPVQDHHDALVRVLKTLSDQGITDRISVVGHRVAHGGPDCDCPLAVTPALLERLRDLVPLAPLHLPANIAGIEAVSARRPDIPQIACFDTAFHNQMPGVAQMTGLPLAMQSPELRRYGYHGLSYEYIVEALGRDWVDVASERIIVAHLGNGASLAAIRNGRSIDTTMGFSTISGVPMGTRSGDIDPGLLLHLQTDHGMSAEELGDLLETGAGLLGLSGVSRNMADLIDHHDPASADAIRYFCYHVRRHLVALTAPLEGIDRLVFTGGIGTNAAQVRSLVCAGLDYLGLKLDAVANEDNSRIISARSSRVVVEVRETDEESMIAAHVYRLCGTCADTVREAS
ncbi:hypothetical protein ATO11_04030 [Pseudaestuariivita atlantica]|uniref:Acetate kinase n=2 Tax=Pseudaestuariivita atlantica TaxID=1317121 RepID=A0A0L1JTD6_9RHOB|nr:hypothetical protein ATO11_04030 [Pseudaestuariivita atlantica]